MSHQKDSSLIFVGIACLVIGVLTGYVVGENSVPKVAPMVSSPTMKHEMADMMAGLRGKTGDAFDQAFLSEMIVHHEGAVDMAEAVLTTSKRPELAKLARDIIAAQTKEIEMMKMWEKKWFGNSR